MDVSGVLFKNVVGVETFRPCPKYEEMQVT